MEEKNCLEKVREPKTFGFEFEGSRIQIWIHRDKEWTDCYLLIKVDDNIMEFKCDSSGHLEGVAPKHLACCLLNLPEESITLKVIQYPDSQLRDYLKEQKGIEL